MITDEERKSIIEEAVNKAIEKALLIMPETIGNLMVSHVALHKLNTQFYADHPEFKDKKDIVVSVIEMIEGKNPLAKYEDILEKAVPEIRSRINIVKGLDMQNVTTKPNRDFKSFVADGENINNNGEI